MTQSWCLSYTGGDQWLVKASSTSLERAQDQVKTCWMDSGMTGGPLPKPSDGLQRVDASQPELDGTATVARLRLDEDEDTMGRERERERESERAKGQTPAKAERVVS